VICIRQSEKIPTQLIGNLPKPRVNSSPPFSHRRWLRRTVRRHTVCRTWSENSKILCSVIRVLCYKGDSFRDCGILHYSFLAAFRGFVSRRGLPAHMYSDNGTNFHDADHELQTSFYAMNSDPILQAGLANDNGILFLRMCLLKNSGKLVLKVWSFICSIVIGHARSPRLNVRRCCQIAACLNSRPIAALSDDPSDLSELTPSHFLIGRPLVSSRNVDTWN